MTIGFHASHEQFSPRNLLDLAIMAEKSGFDSILSSDHFHPWSKHQGESGFAWSWIGAAMQATKIDFGIVNAPGQRYHPAIIAQAVATLDNMFPNRFWYCAGSGEAINEKITGKTWPFKKIRNERLKESIFVMKELWAGKKVNFSGHIKIENAQLYTLPRKAPKVYGAALTKKTAAWLSDWSDGLITTSKPLPELKKIIEAFQTKSKKPMIVKMQISYDTSKDRALEGAFQQWKNNVFDSEISANLNTPEQFDAIGKMVHKDDMEENILIGTKASDFLDPIKELLDLGFEKIIVHNVNENQKEFIEYFGTQVLPPLKEIK